MVVTVRDRSDSWNRWNYRGRRCSPLKAAFHKPADTRKIAESADLWATSGKTEERRYGHIMIGKKEEILIHWDVPEPNGKVKLVLTNPFLSQRHEWDVTGYIQTKTPNVEMSFHGYEAQGEFTIEDNGVRVGSPLDVDIKDE